MSKKITVVLAIMALQGYHATAQSRMYKKRSYEIVDTSYFTLYRRAEPQFGMKGSLPSVTQYFFSVKRDSPILPLTINELEAAFSQNTTFRYLLDSHFRNDAVLMDYDKYLSMYKVKYLYQKSLD